MSGTVCPTCATPTDESHAFCENCGAALGTASGVAGSVPTVGAPLERSTELLPGETQSGLVRGPLQTSTPVSAVVAPTTPCVSCGKGPITESYCDVCGTRQPDPRDHFEETPAPWVAGVCDKGIVHARNEDAMSIAAQPEPGSLAILVVCDGVTTAPLSERASLAGARAARDVLVASAAAMKPNAEQWCEAIRQSCTAAQAETLAVAESLGQPLNPPSCTFVVNVVQDGVIHSGWCGDSRSYWLPDVGTALITSIDDSIASQMIAGGTPRETAEADHRAHTITRWLGADSPDPTARTSITPIDGPGWVAVVSDGMWNYVSSPDPLRAKVHEFALIDAAPLAVAKAMVAFANSQGGHDNITVALARIEVMTSSTLTDPLPTT